MTPRQLPRNLEPLEGESLPGFLLRTAYRLDRSPVRIAELCGLDVRQRRLSSACLRTIREETLRQFAFTARLTEHEADGLTLRRFTQTYPPLSRLRTNTNRIGSAASVNWAMTCSSRYCPDCLKGDTRAVEQSLGGGWQLLWHLPVVFACVRHRRLLEYLCPACNLPLNAAGGAAGHGHSTLIKNAGLTGLHPLECRNTVPRQTGDRSDSAERARSVLCRARLDGINSRIGTGLPNDDLDQLLSLQQRVLDYLSPQGQRWGRDAMPDRSYFSDLIAITHLMKLTWPLGAEFLPSSHLAALVQAHAEPVIAQLTAEHRGRGVWSGRGAKVAPDDSLICGALLLGADVLLGDRELGALRARVQPLASEAYRRARSYAGGICRSADISTALARVTVRRIHGLPLRRNLRTVSTQHRFRVEEIPSFLPRPWFEQHFAAFIRLLPSGDAAIERHLRRAASLRLAELVSGTTWAECAAAVGMQQKLAERTLKYLGRHLDTLGLWPAFEEVVEQIAKHLDATAPRVDYADRRRRLASWRLPVHDWRAMCDGLPRLDRLRENADTRIGSALIWAEATQGERMRSPVVLDLRQRGEDTQPLASRLGRLSDGLRGPSLRLRRRLRLYAERLATSCDHKRDLAVPVLQIVRDETDLASNATRDKTAQEGLEAMSWAAMPGRAVRELRDPVEQMVPDTLWDLFQQVVPTTPEREPAITSRRHGNRESLAAIVFTAISGCGWNQLPLGFGLSGQTAYRRFIEWTEAGVWIRLRQLLPAIPDTQGESDWPRHAIDAVSARADKREHRRHRMGVTSTGAQQKDSLTDLGTRADLVG
ncbi:TniQ family protein [Streptomyces sp. CG1]|uniref:TniQ family protein n=1 Tax=Streptomyces sp. CG1 TaxID=1287523 RepID=UPI0034E2AA68